MFANSGDDDHMKPEQSDHPGQNVYEYSKNLNFKGMGLFTFSPGGAQ